jgi:hypothetical protein
MSLERELHHVLVDLELLLGGIAGRVETVEAAAGVARETRGAGAASASTTEPGARDGKTESELKASGSDVPPIDESSPKPRPRNYSWAELMRRVFEVDVLECPKCGSVMRILAAIHPPEATRALLDCVGLASRPLPVRPPVPDTTLDLEAWY